MELPALHLLGDAQELLPQLGGDRIPLEGSGEPDGDAHLREVVAAVRTQREVLLEPPPVARAQGVLEIVGYQLDQLLTGHLVRFGHGVNRRRSEARLPTWRVFGGCPALSSQAPLPALREPGVPLQYLGGTSDKPRSCGEDVRWAPCPQRQRSAWRASRRRSAPRWCRRSGHRCRHPR